MPVFRISKTRDYTVMSNHHLRDRNLSLKAKGLLSMMLSLPEGWDYTVYGLAAICKEGRDSIRNALIELEEHGYLVRERMRNDKGQVTDIAYTIYEKPVTHSVSGVEPVTENSTQAEEAFPEPESQNPKLDEVMLFEPITENPTQDTRLLANATQLNTKLLSTEESSTETINPSIHQDGVSDRKGLMDKTDEMDAMDAYRQVIMHNIGHDTLAARYGADRVSEIVELMLEVICSEKPRIYIAGENRYAPLVKARMLKLEFCHIEYVLQAMDVQTGKIHNIRSYLLTALYNAPLTISSYYAVAVNHDLSKGSGVIE